MLGASVYGAELGARVTSAELPATSMSRLRRAQDLGASDNGAELMVHILKSYLQEHICEFFSKKKAKK